MSTQAANTTLLVSSSDRDNSASNVDNNNNAAEQSSFNFFTSPIVTVMACDRHKNADASYNQQRSWSPPVSDERSSCFHSCESDYTNSESRGPTSSPLPSSPSYSVAPPNRVINESDGHHSKILTGGAATYNFLREEEVTARSILSKDRRRTSNDHHYNVRNYAPQTSASGTAEGYPINSSDLSLTKDSTIANTATAKKKAIAKTVAPKTVCGKIANRIHLSLVNTRAREEFLVIPIDSISRKGQRVAGSESLTFCSTSIDTDNSHHLMSYSQQERGSKGSFGDLPAAGFASRLQSGRVSSARASSPLSFVSPSQCVTEIEELTHDDAGAPSNTNVGTTIKSDDTAAKTTTSEAMPTSARNTMPHSLTLQRCRPTRNNSNSNIVKPSEPKTAQKDRSRAQQLGEITDHNDASDVPNLCLASSSTRTLTVEAPSTRPTVLPKHELLADHEEKKRGKKKCAGKRPRCDEFGVDTGNTTSPKNLSDAFFQADKRNSDTTGSRVPATFLELPSSNTSAGSSDQHDNRGGGSSIALRIAARRHIESQ